MAVILNILQASIAPPSGIEEIIERITLQALREHGLLETAEVSLMLCDNRTIHRLNREWRAVDDVTDVLSFPQFTELNECQDVSEGVLLLGDIVISLERAEEQAHKFGHGLERELLYLFTHGLLHLLGYNHSNKEEQQEMRQREERLLAGVGAVIDE